MPIRSPLNQTWTHGSYEADRNELIKERENARLKERTFQTGVHSPKDAKGDENITIGYGWDIDEQSLSSTTHRLEAAGIELSDNQKTVLEAYKKGEEATFKIGDKEITRVPTQDDFELAWSDFTITDAQATHMLNAELAKREQGLNDAFKGHEIPQSQERIALMSLFYNTTSGTGAAIRNFAPTTTALIESNPQTPEEIIEQRFNLWYEIKYGSNYDRDNNLQKGLQYRRDEESERFGLYSQVDEHGKRFPDPTNDHFEARTVQRLHEEKNENDALVSYRTNRDIDLESARDQVDAPIIAPPPQPSSAPDHSRLDYNPNHVASAEIPPLNFNLDHNAQEAIAFVDQMDQDYAPELKRDGPASAPSVSPT